MQFHKVHLTNKGGQFDWSALKASAVRRTLSSHSKLMHEYLPRAVLVMAQYFMGKLHGKHFNKHELEQIATKSGLPFYEVLSANMAYEWAQAAIRSPFRFCTSAVVRIKGKMHHYRTLDWPLEGTGTNSCVVDWDSRFQSVGWPGFIGIVSGAKKGFSISLNQATPTAIVQYGKPPVLAIREAFETCRTYRGAVKFLMAVKTASNCSFIICGTDEACILEKRGRKNLMEYMKDNVLVKTNHNQYDDQGEISVLDSIMRKQKAETILGKAVVAGRAPSCGQFAVPPIRHEFTAQVMKLDPYAGKITGYGRNTDAACLSLS